MLSIEHLVVLHGKLIRLLADRTTISTSDAANACRASVTDVLDCVHFVNAGVSIIKKGHPKQPEHYRLRYDAYAIPRKDLPR
jgi:hypothetical protein